jgi:hypothetical protein
VLRSNVFVQLRITFYSIERRSIDGLERNRHWCWADSRKFKLLFVNVHVEQRLTQVIECHRKVRERERESRKNNNDEKEKGFLLSSCTWMFRMTWRRMCAPLKHNLVKYASNTDTNSMNILIDRSVLLPSYVSCRFIRSETNKTLTSNCIST